MSDFQYKRAPITEAAVEFRFSSEVSSQKRKNGLKKLAKLYELHKPETRKNYKVEIRPNGKPIAESTDTIIDKFTSIDQVQQLHIMDSSFVVSQLAPYSGWGRFCERIRRDWEALRSSGFMPVDFAGVRYINRIDIPATGEVVAYEDYLNVYPKVPPVLDPCNHYGINVRVELPDIKSRLNVNSTIVESPLPKHMAIVVDLDIRRGYDEPPSDEELYSFIDQARLKKNEVFEACITDKARELFK